MSLSSRLLTVSLLSSLFVVPVCVAGDGLENAEISGVQYELNNTSYAAANLLDFNTQTRWLNNQQTNDINILLNSTGDPACFAGLSLQNYNTSTRNIQEFALLTTNNDALAADFGTAGWQPIASDDDPTDLLNYLSWAQGARMVSYTYQQSATTYAAEHINDGDTVSRWMSNSGGNTFEFNFDADWDETTGDPINIAELELLNYGTDDRSVREFQVQYTLNGVDWLRLELPGSAVGDNDFVYTRSYDGGSLDRIDGSQNVTSWAGEHANDGDPNTRWMSNKNNNFLEFSFDPNLSGVSGKDGDVSDLFEINKIRLRNYGNNDDRSVRQFQVAVKTILNPNWSKVTVPGAQVGEADYNFAMVFHGADMTASSQANSTASAAEHMNDGDRNTRWLALELASIFEFEFDPEENGITGEASDLFTFESLYLINYGNDDRSINEFQIEVKTTDVPEWTPIRVPGASVGDANFNFALVNNGGQLTSIDNQVNETTWAGANLNDGSHKTRWLSLENNNVLEYAFDLDRDGSVGGTDDLFTFDRFYIQNYGNDDRSIYEFQIQVKTIADSNWRAIPRPGATVGDADFNFALLNNGGVLTSIDSEVNDSQWAAENIQDGDFTTRWLSNKMNNSLDFEFDVDGNGTTAESTDGFTIERFFLQNYGTDDRSVKNFQVHIKIGSDTQWQPVMVPGSAAGDPDYNFALAAHGGTITDIDDELNDTSWAATNMQDGDIGTRWLSNKQQNVIVFEFDADLDGTTGDVINLDTIKMVNYGTDDRSVQTFQLEYQDGTGIWLPVIKTDGTTTFTANMDRNEQSWTIDELTGVTAVRFLTLTNYGDANYTGLSELRLEGKTVGPIATFTAQMNGNGEYFELDPNNYPTDVRAVRFKTLTNYDDLSYVGVREFKVLGPSTLETTIFTAQMNDDGEIFTLDSNDVPTDVTGVRLVTVSNHGDATYIGAREFKLLGNAVNETTIFNASMNDDGEAFVFDADDVRDNVSAVRIVTISNHGDQTYIGGRQIEIRGPSVTETKTFVGQMSVLEQTFVLDAEDIPSDVTDVQFMTINNYGDANYVGLREFEILGKGVTPNYTFTLPMTKGPHRIVLDDEDIISGATAVRLMTINNHGDATYTGLTEFKLFGAPEIPGSPSGTDKYSNYIFTADNVSTLQTFEFDDLNAKYLRIHTMSNYGNSTNTEAAEIGLVEGNCASGQWHLDEVSWSGENNEVLDNSSAGLHGKAYGFDNGTGANTAGGDPAIAGTIGTCRYGTFDGVDDYIEIPDSSGLDNTAQLTMSAWFKADTLSQTNGTNARGIFSKRPSFTNNISYGVFFLKNAGGKLYIDIDTQNNRFTTNTVFETDRWYHLAIVFDGTLAKDERVAVYVDGQLDGKYSEDSTFIPDTDSNFYIGNLYTGTSVLKVFDGAIDEVNVLPFAYSQTQVNTLMNQTRPCDAIIDHVRITHSGSGVSCAAHSVNLTACANADCSSIYTGADLNFTLQKNDAGVVSDIGTYVIPGATGQLNGISYDETTVGTYSLTGSSSEVSTVQCLNTATGAEDCDYTVTSSGFVVTNGNYGNALSCSTNTFTIQAVQASGDASSGACVPAYASGNYPVTFSYDYVEPSSSVIANPANATIAGVSHSASQTGTAQNIAFDANAQATIDVGYAEAGQLSVTVNDANGDLTSTTAVIGFVPAQLTASWSDGDANNIAGITEQAVIAGQCSDGTVLQNYVPSGDYQVQASRVAPSDLEITSANNGVTPSNLETLLVAKNTMVTPNGSAENVNVTNSSNTQILDIDYDEVARLQFSFTDNNYLGETISTATSLTGEFGISHYTATINTPKLAATCNAYSYVGQAINWTTTPQVTITARNAIDGITEFADIDTYWKQDAATIGAGFIGNAYTEITSNNNNAVTIDNTAISVLETNTESVDGARSYDVVGQLVKYSKTRLPDVAFDANLDLTIAASTFVDTLGVGIKSNASDPAYLPVEFSGIDGTELQYGRLKVQSTYGSELEDLPWKAQIETYQANGEWQLQTTDNCTVLTQSAVTIDGINEFDVEANGPKYTLDISGEDTSLVGFSGQTTVTSISGLITLPFASPGDGNVGSLDIDIDLTSEAPFLRWDWDDDGTGSFTDADGDGIDDYLDLNLATTSITFGRYRGNDRIIYKRERNL